ncbi:MAG: hypothetical protein K2P81_08215 [Bacteriovoracaceae bacterium]|nr:hypothetical protein [Bacteriovoracaceae bacterium]
MFYLKEFFSTLLDIKGRGAFFLLSSLMLAFVCAFRPSVQSTITALAPEAWARPYFTALFDSTVEKQDVLDEIANRPEVASVETLANQETGGVLGRLISQIGQDYAGKVQDVAAFGLRIILKNQTFMPAGETLLNGLEESYGREHVTTSGLRTPRVGGLFQTHPIFKYLSRYGFFGVFVPVLTVWIFAFVLCFPHFSRRAWLVERYQRRHLVRAKMVASGLASFVLIATLSSLVLQGPDLIGVALIVACFSIPWTATMREVKWRWQN